MQLRKIHIWQNQVIGHIQKNSILKTTTESVKKYNKHQNFCGRLYKKERKNYFDILDVNKIIDNKVSWKKISNPFFLRRENSQTK